MQEKNMGHICPIGRSRVNKQNKTLRALTVDFSSQTDLPLPPAKELPPQNPHH